MTQSQACDNLNRLSGLESAPASGPVVSDNYQLNLRKERTSANLADGSHRDCLYHSTGGVTSGRKVWSDGTSVGSRPTLPPPHGRDHRGILLR